MLSSIKMDWETPKELFNEINKEFGFTLDFCATDKNKKVNRFYSEKDDALKQFPINEIIWCNPPYGNKIKDFVKKCYELSNNNIIVMLIPARTDTTYFHKYVYNNAEIRFIKGRIKFIGNQKGSGSAPFPSMLCIFSKKKQSQQAVKESLLKMKEMLDNIKDFLFAEGNPKYEDWVKGIINKIAKEDLGIDLSQETKVNAPEKVIGFNVGKVRNSLNRDKAETNKTPDTIHNKDLEENEWNDNGM